MEPGAGWAVEIKKNRSQKRFFGKFLFLSNYNLLNVVMEQHPGDCMAKMNWSGFDWKDISSRLTLWAHRRLMKNRHQKMSWKEAEDYANQAISQVFDPHYLKRWKSDIPVDGPDQKDLMACLGGVVRGLISNDFGRESEVLKPTESKSGCPTQDELIEAQEIIDMVRLLIGNDKVAKTILELILDGEITKPREQAKALGLKQAEIYKARKRLNRKFRICLDVRKKQGLRVSARSGGKP